MSIDPNQRLIQRLKSQIEIAKGVNGDFVYMTVGDAKRVLKAIDKEDTENRKKLLDILDKFEAVWDNCDSLYSPCEEFRALAYEMWILTKEEIGDAEPAHRD